jgi:hypothetical protein
MIAIFFNDSKKLRGCKIAFPSTFPFKYSKKNPASFFEAGL